MRPYEVQQEELIRYINQHASKSKLMLKLRDRLLNEQRGKATPTLAFIYGCEVLNRKDLYAEKK